jgi:hypothetical protein
MSVLIALMLVVSAVVLALPLVFPTHATSDLVQTASSDCSDCTSISVTLPHTVQSGDALIVMVCWSGVITGESFSDSSTTNSYQEIVSRSDSVECAGAWARAAGTSSVTETVSWSGSVDAIINVYEAYSASATISPIRNSATGTGTSFSLGLTSNGPDIVSMACYATASPVTLTAGVSYALDGVSTTGGCEHATNTIDGTQFNMTASAPVTWVGIGLVILTPGAGGTQCSGGATTTFTCRTAHNTNQVGIGDLLVVLVSRTYHGGTWSISDNMSNVWTSVGSVSNTAKVQAWYTVAKSYGYDDVTVDFADSSAQMVEVMIMDFGPEGTNQTITYSTGTGIGSSFSAASQTMAIGMGLAMIATSSNPGTITPGPGYYAWPNTAAGEFEDRIFGLRTSNTCSASGTNTVSWAEICVSVRFGIVETLSLENAPNTTGITPSNHFTVSYKFDGQPRSLSARGETTTWVDDQSDTNSISATTSGSTSAHRWVIRALGDVAFPQTWSSGNTQKALSKIYTYYEQFRNAIQITPLSPSTWDASRTVKVDGVQMGNYLHIVTFTPPNGSSVQSASVWTDRGQFFTWEPSTGGASGQSWVPDPLESSVLYSGNGIYNSNYTLRSAQATTTATTTAVSYSTATTTFSTTYTTTNATTLTQTQTVTKTHTEHGNVTTTTTATETSTVTSGITDTQTVTSATTVTQTQTQTIGGTTTETMTSYVGPTQTKTITSATTQTINSGTTHTQTVTSATTQTVSGGTTQTQTVTSATTHTQTVTSETTQTVSSGTTQTKTQTATSATTATQTQTATSTATVTSTKTTTSVTTQGGMDYLWILVILPVVVFLLALYILRKREKA